MGNQKQKSNPLKTLSKRKMQTAAECNADIDAKINGNKVMVFSKSYCPHCNYTKQLLESKGVEFGLLELDNLQNGDQVQNALRIKTGQNTVPNIFINQQHIGGNSDLQSLNQNGQLDQKLAE